ncbi:cellulase family glycosylhydrolase [Bacteroides sp. ET489]|uniref:cellulase family glycosylhydrolase n=1 Tax=Bacteroides sp. ET489 TaxID=3057126 RepID=UPI0026710CF4|nr:cellulase family glycosylhydrolase [Bacteroides sp. ET489]MDO3390925.1 cellulase family glycosylhydrolase [Bacteroides sp. ET489]
MKNKLHTILLLFVCFLSLFACEDINDKHDIYMRDGEELHVGKMDSLYLYPGNLRAQLKCWITDRRSVWLMVQKDNSEEEQWISLPEGNREDSIVVYIEGLDEGSNQLTFMTTNEDKSVFSVPLKQSVTVYGEKFQQGLMQRTVEHVEAAEGFLRISWGPKTTEQLVGEKICYKDINGKECTHVTSADNNVSVISNVDLSAGMFEYSSLYLPVSTAVDTFAVNKEKVEYTITPRPEGMKKNAIQIAKEIKLGWNLGNSLEVGSGETAWGNPKTTKELITAVKNAGFSAVRIPCIWTAYASNDGTYKIQADRMARVKEVVDYCIDNGLYVILNTMHDWIDKFNYKEYDENKVIEADNKIKIVWGQIADNFNEYGDKLLFAFANECDVPRASMPVFKRFEQTFVDVVRKSGGNNLYRTLVVQCPMTDIDRAYQYMDLVTDPTPLSLMTEVHYYTPWSFCGVNEGTFFWGEDYKIYGQIEEGYQEDYVCSQFNKVREMFTSKGIPVVLGEFGAQYGNKVKLEDPELQAKAEESRAYFMQYVTEQAKNYGLIPFIWDDGWNFPLMDRRNCKVIETRQMDMDALNKGAEAGVYPF